MTRKYQLEQAMKNVVNEYIRTLGHHNMLESLNSETKVKEFFYYTFANTLGMPHNYAKRYSALKTEAKIVTEMLKKYLDETGTFGIVFLSKEEALLVARNELSVHWKLLKAQNTIEKVYA